MAAWTTFASRFCSCEVPASWTQVPGLGAVENRDKGFRSSVAVTENWLEPAVTARAYADKQVELLQQEVRGVEMVKNEALPDGRFDDSWLVVLRTRGPDGERFLQRQLTAVCGNLVCCLTFSGLERDTREWAEICERAHTTFTVNGREQLRTVRRDALLASGPAATTSSLTPLPLQQVAVPLRAGWTADAAAGTLRRGDATITVTNRGFGGSPDQLFGEALARAVREPGKAPQTWDTDKPPEGVRFALETAAESRGTWVGKPVAVERRVFLEDTGAILELGLSCKAGDTEAFEAFAAVVQHHPQLEPDARRLRLSESWLPVELKGPWAATSPGLYMRMAHPVLLLGLQRVATPQGLAKHAATMSQALRGQPEIASVSRDESAEGSFKGLRAVRHTLDCVTRDGEPLAFRTAWLEVGQEVCSIELRGADTAATEQLFRNLLESLEPAALRGTGGGR